MKSNAFLPTWILAVVILAFSSCEKDQKSSPDNEQELITTIRLTFTAPSGSVTFNAKDTDGDGGLAPVIDGIALKANTTYALNIEFLDESKGTAINLTPEVREEGTDHLVCLAASGAMPNPTVEDQDTNKAPLGLTSLLTTGAAGTGTLKITLKHLADKSSANACNTGETDAEATFAVTINP